MSYLKRVATALPEFKAGQDEILDAARLWLKTADEEFELFKRFLSSSQTSTRHFVMPPDQIVKLGGSKIRSEIFEREAPKLAEVAVSNALEYAGVRPKDIGGVIFTSCSCPLIPAIDTFLVEQFGLRRDVVRIPSYQYGCAGGIIGLGLANRLAPTLENILVVSAELCSLVFQPENCSASHLVGAAIFGDGAAATVVSNRRPNRSGGDVEIIAHRSFLLPKSRHLMGYDIRDTGSHLRLDKELPAHLVEAVPKLADEFLEMHGLRRSDIPWWLFHPGGTKILNCLHEVLSLGSDQAPWAGEVLHTVGNLSSATILYVLDRFLSSQTAKSGDNFVIVGVGPGLTIEMILARYVN